MAVHGDIVDTRGVIFNAQIVLAAVIRIYEFVDRKAARIRCRIAGTAMIHRNASSKIATTRTIRIRIENGGGIIGAVAVEVCGKSISEVVCSSCGELEDISSG